MALITAELFFAKSQNSFVSVSAWGTYTVSYICENSLDRGMAGLNSYHRCTSTDHFEAQDTRTAKNTQFYLLKLISCNFT